MKAMTDGATLEEIFGEDLIIPLGAESSGWRKPGKPERSKRITDKVLLSRKQAALLLEEVNRYMRPSRMVKGALFTRITSHYLDSDELELFRQHFLETPTRYKLSVSRYAPDGVRGEGTPFLELKTRELGFTEKLRFALTQDNYKRLMKGQIIRMTAELLALNPELGRERLQAKVRKINGLIIEYGLRPSLKVQYKRYSFEDEDGFRLALDMDLKIEEMALDIAGLAGTRVIPEIVWEEAERLAAKYQGECRCIVEMNHTGRPPLWVGSFLKEFKIPNTTFSKYCWAVNQASGPEISARKTGDGRLLLAGSC